MKYALIILSICIFGYLNSQELNWANKIEVTNEEGVNSDKSEFSPAYWNNYVVFSSEGKINDRTENEAQYDLYLSAITRENRLMGRALFSKTINTELNESQACFFNNGYGLLYTGVIQSGGEKEGSKTYILQIKQSDLDNEEWSEAIVLDTFQHHYPSCHPTLDNSASLLVFASDRPGGYGKMDLYYTSRSGSVWSEPVNLGPLVNSPGNDWFPTLVDKQYLFYASDTPNNGLDLFLVLLKDKVAIKKAILPEPLNSSSDDFSLITREDGMEGYFASNRTGGMGSDDLYAFSSYKSLFSLVQEESHKLTLKIRSDKTYEIINDAVIRIKPLEEEKVKAFDQSIFEFKSDDQVISFNPDNSGRSSIKLFDGYTLLEVSHPGYQNWVKVFLNDGKDSAVDIFMKEKEKETDPDTLNQDKLLINTPIDVGSVIIFENIYYDYNSFEIKKGAAFELDALEEFMKANKNVRIELRAHTDSRGEHDYNQDLSEKRARAVKKYLMEKGIDGKRIEAKGFGEQQLRNHCHDGVLCSEAEHIYNRRTEVVILAK